MDSQRLQDLYQQHAAALILYARQWCTAPDDALQEAMLALANCRPEPHDPAAWLYTTTKRRALNIARADARRQQYHARAAEERSQWFVTQAAKPSVPGSELETEAVAVGLESLEEDERELVVARVWGNLTFEQLGKLRGCSASAAHRHYQAALLKLRRVVDETCEQNRQSSPSSLNQANIDQGVMPPGNLLTGENL